MIHVYYVDECRSFDRLELERLDKALNELPKNKRFKHTHDNPITKSVDLSFLAKKG